MKTRFAALFLAVVLAGSFLGFVSVVKAEYTPGSWLDPKTWVQSRGAEVSEDSTVRGRLDQFQNFAGQIFGPEAQSRVATEVETQGNPAARFIFEIVNIILGFLGGLAVAFGVYAAFLWMTAGGNEETITKARTLLVNTVIGLALMLSALLLSVYLEVTVAGVNRIAIGKDASGFCRSGFSGGTRVVTDVLSLGTAEVICAVQNNK